MRSFILSVLLLCTSVVVTAQKQELSLKDAILNRFATLYPERMQQLQWVDGNTLSYVDDHDGQPALFIQKVDGPAGAVLGLDELASRMGDDVKLGSFPRIQWTSSQTFQFKKGNNIYEASLDKKKVQTIFELPEGIQAMALDEARQTIAYVLEDQLYFLEQGGESKKVTSDGGNGIVYGQSVHRNEFGITGGLFWSPDGKKLAFYRMDESMVTDYPLVDIHTRPAQLRNIKYPMAGQNSHEVTLGVYDLSSEKVTYMKTGEPNDQYLCSVSWSPNGSDVYIAVLNRDQNHLDLNRYNAVSGELEKTLFSEDDEQYVEPEHSLWFLPFDANKFIWMSERDGFQHMYLYDTEGKMIKPLSTGNWEVQKIHGVDPTNRYIYVTGTGEVKYDRNIDDERNALQRYTYVIDMELGGVNMIEGRKGTHMAQLSPDGSHVIEHFTSVDVPWDTKLFTSMGLEVATLHTADDPMANYAISKPELGSIPASFGDGNLYTRIIKPSGFDPSKKYPVLMYVYGGPHAQLITDSYLAAAPLWMYWMAERGYIVATVDNRGSAHRGIEFEQSTFGQLGVNEMVDQKSLVEHLTSLEYVDKDRMAIHGWSYGGFMTINMLVTFPGMFKVGVAGGPVCDWSLYEVMYTERYMDTPETNPEGFASTSLVNRADKLQDDLLIIHGTVDDVVVWQHSQEFLKACVDNEIPVDYFVYPGHPHNVRGKDRFHLMRKVLSYIDEKLK